MNFNERNQHFLVVAGSDEKLGRDFDFEEKLKKVVSFLLEI